MTSVPRPRNSQALLESEYGLTRRIEILGKGPVGPNPDLIGQLVEQRVNESRKQLAIRTAVTVE